MQIVLQTEHLRPSGIQTDALLLLAMADAMPLCLAAQSL
jgi:hypothetical protein